jgi:hypothetical protein
MPNDSTAPVGIVYKRKAEPVRAGGVQAPSHSELVEHTHDGRTRSLQGRCCAGQVARAKSRGPPNSRGIMRPGIRLIAVDFPSASRG